MTDFSLANAFLAERDSRDAANPPAGFQTILFTDLESSTALTQQLGDAAARELHRRHDATVRAALDAHGGREVKRTGDGIMASFGSAVAAVDAALRIQGDLEGEPIRVRVGINAGEPIVEGDDLFGTAVNSPPASRTGRIRARCWSATWCASSARASASSSSRWARCD